MRTLLLGLILLTMVAPTGAAQSGAIEVRVTAVRNDDGQVFVSLYNQAEGFPGKEEKALQTLTAKQAGGLATVVFEGLPYGEYAVAAYHDEDGNGKMKTVYGSIPVEGVGISRDAKGVMGPPRFKDAAFELAAERLTIDVRIHY